MRPRWTPQGLTALSWAQVMCLGVTATSLEPLRAGCVCFAPVPHCLCQVGAILSLLRKAQRPVVYCGGGCLHAYEEVREFAELAGVPVVSTLMGLGVVDQSEDRALHMLGMHGTVYANYAVDSSDLLLAFGVRFDDRVTGKLDVSATLRA